jgi:hypothetical protein
MSNLTAKQRRELPLEDFGQPSKRLFPILDQADVDAAARLIGKASDPEAVKKKIIAICKRKGLKPPAAWTEKAIMAALSAVALADASSTLEADGMVRRTALITTAGAFPDHDWEITPDELKASADAFAGRGYVEIEHFKSHGTRSILDAHTGYVDGVWTSEDGAELWGDLVLPPWLNEIADANGGKVSAVFDKEAKGFLGVGLVLEPAVPEAAMLSAFVDFAKRHDTPRGQYAVQDLHDSAVRHGAVCTAGNATMASKHEAGAIQQIHDLAVDHGAKCDAVGKSGGQMMMYSKAEQTEQTEQTEQEEGQTVPDEQKNTDGKSQEPTVAALQAQLAAEKTQRDADRKALVALQAERRQEKANAFVDALITENKVLPAQRDTLVALHLAAATSDDTRGLVTLADGKEQSLLQSVITALSSFQSLGLTKEQMIANPDVAILLNRQKTQEQEDKDTGTPEDNEKLLAMTPLGRQALQRKRRAAAGH